MSDPDFVKLAEGVTVLSDPISLWSISSGSVASFPTDHGEAIYVRRNVRFGRLVAAPAGFEGIYMQATQPSNPSNGDVWIDTNGGERAIWTYDGSWAQWGEVDPP